MKVFNFRLCTAVFCVMLTGCSTYELPDINLLDERLPVSRAIAVEKVKTLKPYQNIERVGFTVVDAEHDMNYEAYQKFMILAIKKIGFNRVLTKRELAELIIDKDINANLSDVISMEDLHAVYQATEPYIYIETRLTFIAGGAMKNSIKVIDPRKSEILVEVVDRRANALGVDLEYLYPTVNFLTDWYKLSL